MECGDETQIRDAPSKFCPSVATLPPSKTTSGLFGHFAESVTPVELHGDRSPGLQQVPSRRSRRPQSWPSL